MLGNQLLAKPVELSGIKHDDSHPSRPPSCADDRRPSFLTDKDPSYIVPNDASYSEIGESVAQPQTQASNKIAPQNTDA